MQNYRVQLTILNNTYLVNIKCNLCKYNIKGYFIAVFNPALNNSDFWLNSFASYNLDIFQNAVTLEIFQNSTLLCNYIHIAHREK